MAVRSQLKLKGYSDDALIFVSPSGENAYMDEGKDIYPIIESNGDEIALILFGGINYLTGQLLDIPEITRRAKEKGIAVGFDLAHAVGNVKLELHNWNVDFSVWCTYKYLNGGPGGTNYKPSN